MLARRVCRQCATNDKSLLSHMSHSSDIPEMVFPRPMSGVAAEIGQRLLKSVLYLEAHCATAFPQPMLLCDC